MMGNAELKMEMLVGYLLQKMGKQQKEMLLYAVELTAIRKIKQNQIMVLLFYFD